MSWSSPHNTWSAGALAAFRHRVRTSQLRLITAAGASLAVLVLMALLPFALTVLLLAAATLGLALTSFWVSLRTLLSQEPPPDYELLDILVPPSEEQQKRRVLQALEDLEIERRLGKISDDDYQALRVRCRSEAKSVLQGIDQSTAPARERAEAILHAALQLDASTPAPGSHAAAPPRTVSPDAVEPISDEQPLRCPACSTTNDQDAAFCKRCGRPLRTTAQDPTP